MQLYHGTLLENLDSISTDWLEPRIGTHVESAYGAYESDSFSLGPAVFMCDEGDLRGVRSAILVHIANKLGRSMRDVTEEDIIKHGLVVVVKPDSSVFQLLEDGSTMDLAGNISFLEHPLSVEPGDYFSLETQQVAGFIHGEAILRFLEYGPEPHDPRLLPPAKLISSLEEFCESLYAFKGGLELPDRSSGEKPVSWPSYLAKRWRHTAVVGFTSKENPTAQLGKGHPGHPFAIIDNRYLVDVWAGERLLAASSAVLDLADPKNTDEVYELWGAPSTWRELDIAAQRVGNVITLSDEVRATLALPGRRTTARVQPGRRPR